MDRLSWEEKRYGRITGSELAQFLEIFSEVWRDRAALKEELLDEGKYAERVAKFASVLNWLPLYQIPLLHLLGSIIKLTGLEQATLEALSKPQLNRALLDLCFQIPDEPPDDPNALAHAFAMLGNLDAIARYSRSINDMLVACRDRGDMNAFLQALSVDSYISSSTVCQAMLRIGQLAGDASTAEAVFNAIKGPHKKRMVYPELRWAEYLLRDQGAFSACTQDEIHDLIVVRLKLYDDDTRKKDSKKSLFALFRKWQKEAGI